MSKVLESLKRELKLIMNCVCVAAAPPAASPSPPLSPLFMDGAVH